MFRLFYIILIIISYAAISQAQTRSTLVPQPVEGSPFMTDDLNDHFGRAYRWFLEGFSDSAVVNLRQVIVNAGYKMNPKNYYIVVAHFTDSFVPIGMLHEDSDFYDNRMYGLHEKSLYYVFISRTENAPSFLSVLATAKDSPFDRNLPEFLNLFTPLLGGGAAVKLESVDNRTWVDVRNFHVPEAFRKNSDIAFMVKKKLSDEKVLASMVYDNTALERWSFGIAGAVTSTRDLDFVIGEDGTIIVRPKPEADLSAFGVINYHFFPVDTKAKTLETSFHALFGLRLDTILEPIIGIGGGISTGQIDIHLFAGYSFEFANTLKNGYAVGQVLKAGEDPFKLKVRGKPRFGIEFKFP